MSAAAAPRPDTHGHPVARVSHLDAMDHLRDPACEALVWDRAVPSGIAAALDDLPIGPLDNLRVTTPADHVGAWVKEILTGWDWPTPSARAWLQSDITTLAPRTISTNPFIQPALMAFSAMSSFCLR